MKQTFEIESLGDTKIDADCIRDILRQYYSDHYGYPAPIVTETTTKPTSTSVTGHLSTKGLWHRG